MSAFLPNLYTAIEKSQAYTILFLKFQSDVTNNKRREKGAPSSMRDRFFFRLFIICAIF